MYNIHRRSTFKKRTYPFTTLQKSVSRNNGHTSRLVVTADWWLKGVKLFLRFLPFVNFNFHIFSGLLWTQA